MRSARTKVVYAAVFGNYDCVPAVNPEWDCDFILFTDNLEFVSPGWRIVVVPLNGESAAQANRRYKIFPHRYLAHYKYSLYVDGNIKIIADPNPLFKKYLDHSAIAIPKHQHRECIYEEARLCMERGLVNEEKTKQQMARYLSEGFPEKYGMTENGIILRRHHDQNVIELMESWWEEYCNGGARDQLSLSYLLWKKCIEVTLMEESARNNNKYFRITLHRAAKRSSIVGNLLDYIRCNRHRNLFYKEIHKIVHEIGKLRLLRRVASKLFLR